MAQNNFLSFAENASDILSDSEYQGDASRVSGVSTGIARSDLHNKMYRQFSAMSAAIAKVMADNGFDAMDSDYVALATSFQDFITSVGAGAGGFYGTCELNNNTAVGVATVDDEFKLESGVVVTLKFNVTGGSFQATTPLLLNVNNTGAKNVYIRTPYDPSTSESRSASDVYDVMDDDVYTFMYTGSQWVFISPPMNRIFTGSGQGTVVTPSNVQKASYGSHVAQGLYTGNASSASDRQTLYLPFVPLFVILFAISLGAVGDNDYIVLFMNNTDESGNSIAKSIYGSPGVSYAIYSGASSGVKGLFLNGTHMNIAGETYAYIAFSI